MTDTVLDDIKEYIRRRLTIAYGCCGIVDTDTYVSISSNDGDGKDIEITIKIEDE